MIEFAAGIAQHYGLGTHEDRSVAPGISGTEECDDGGSHGCGQVNWAGIAANHQRSVAHHCGELRDAAGHCFRSRGEGNGLGDRILLVGGVDEDTEASVAEGAGHFCETVGGPLLCAPASGGGDEDEAGVAYGVLEPALCPWVLWNVQFSRGEDFAGDGSH
jgi:hypothetical protein